MMKHSDADVFIRNILSHPEDPDARLLFADWLEATEEPANLAWAIYLRSVSDKAPRALVDFLKCYKDQLKAKIKLHARYFTQHAHDVLRLLPPQHVQLTLEDIYIPLGVLERCPSELARQLAVIPLLELPGKCLLFAALDATCETTRTRLEAETGWSVFLVTTTKEELAEAQLHLYGPAQSMEDTVTETTAVPPTESVPTLKCDPYDGFPVERLVSLLLRDGVRWHATELRLEARASGVLGEYTLPKGTKCTEPFPARLGLPIFMHLQSIIQRGKWCFPSQGHMTFRYGGSVRALQVLIDQHEDGYYYATITFPGA